MKTFKNIKPLQSKNIINLPKHKESYLNAFSFNKSSRFPIPRENNNPGHLVIPSTLDKKACSFGLGKRWEPKSSHCQHSPCPTSYSLQSTFGQTSKKIIDYKKQIVKERELFYIKPIPGPGSYNPKTPKNKHTPSPIIIGRKHIRSYSEIPSPSEYTPNFDFLYKNITSTISFSKAKRNELHRSNNSSPGPGMYEIKSSFNNNDKNQHSKIFKNKSEGRIKFN